MLDKIRVVLAHIKVLWSLRTPARLATSDQVSHEIGMAVGQKLGTNLILAQIARMPRHERRKIITGAVKMFGRKPRRTMPGFRPGVAEDEQDALAYLQGEARGKGWPEWQKRVEEEGSSHA